MESCYEMAKMLNWEIVASEFELHSRYYIHFQSTTPWKVMSSLIPLAMGYIEPQLFFYLGGFDFK